MLSDLLLHAAGPLRADYERVDWAATPLGPPASWSPALDNAIELTLHTRFPVTLMWGPEFVLVYNEAYVQLIADKHPRALGRPSREVFPEIWDTIGPMMQGVLAGNGPTWVEDAYLPLQRQGILEEAYFTFSYSPVRGAGGDIEGVLDIAAETTRQVLDRRRLGLLSRLNEQLSRLERREQLPELALPLLLADPADFPAADIRVPDVLRASGTGLPGAPSSPLRGTGVVVDETPAGRVAWLPLARHRTPALQPVLVVLLSEHLAPDETYLRFLRLIASSLGQALDRVSAREAERGMSEALQRTLLTRPPQPDSLEVAVRYRPAAREAQVGGDWYDSFVLPDGTLTLVIGDVTGHDRQAAAAMAQIRNLLRGVAYTLGEPPALVLAGLDQAMDGLGVDVFATAVLAQVHRAPGGAPGHTLRWSNAGHPPPVLVAADGDARLLEAAPDRLLGLASDGRSDHTVALEPGATVVLFTDGLIERRGVALQQGLDWLTATLAGTQRMSAEAVCDHLTDQLEDEMEDDVALLVLRLPDGA